MTCILKREGFKMCRILWKFSPPETLYPPLQVHCVRVWFARKLTTANAPISLSSDIYIYIENYVDVLLCLGVCLLPRDREARATWQPSPWGGSRGGWGSRGSAEVAEATRKSRSQSPYFKPHFSFSPRYVLLRRPRAQK